MGDMSFEEWQKAKPRPDTTADREQYAEYRNLLHGKAPGSFREFQAIKYSDAKRWVELKKQTAEKRRAIAKKKKRWCRLGIQA